MTSDDDALAQLDDYLSGALSDDHASAYEESLFEAAAAGSALELVYLDSLFASSAWFSATGGFMAGMTRETVTQLRTQPRVHYLDIESETRVPEWPSDTQLVVYRVAIDLRGFDQVDVELRDARGEHIKWFRDCTVEPSDGALYGICDAPIARGAFRKEPIVGIVYASKAGRERQIAGEFRVTPG